MSQDESSSTLNEQGGGGSLIHAESSPVDPTKLMDNDQFQPEYSQTTADTPKNHVLSSNAFMDTFAILMILLQFPTWLTILVHFVFIVTVSPTPVWRDVTRPFHSILSLFGAVLPGTMGGFLSASSSNNSPNAPSNSPQSQSKTSSPTKNQTSFFRILIIDFLCAITTLYLAPILRNVVLVFAHAIVASSLGGGPRTFLNAIYATSIVETVSFFWDTMCEFFHLEHTYSDIVTSAGPRFLRYSINQSLGQPAMTTGAPFSVIIDESTQSFNTFTSVFKIAPTLFKFLYHIDWYSEFPLLLVQMVAVYIVWLALSPFLRGELASSLSSDTLEPVPNGQTNGQITPTLNTTVPVDLADFDEAINFTTFTEDGIRDVVVISVPKEAANQSAEADELPLGNHFFFHGSGKRNKKATVVRSNQPLWSMLASSIVMAARQENIPNGISIPQESLDALAKDRQASDNSAGPSGCYVSYVFEKAVGFFVTGVFTASPDSYIVRVNQVQWRQTVIKFVHVAEDAVGVKPEETQEDGVTVIDVTKESTFDTIFISVHGLTGGTVYDMEIIQLVNEDEIVIGRSKVCTAPTDASANQYIAPPSRPLSPVTTLLDTLSQSQVTLSEIKNSMKRSRKEHTKKMSTIRNEVEQIRAKSESNDKTDERVRRKLLSLRSTVRQLEAEITKAEEHAAKLEVESKEYANGYTAQKREWMEAMNVLEERKKAESSSKEEIAKKLSSIENEKAATISKREKLVTKKERLTGDISKIEQDLDQAIEEELGRRKLAREGKMERRKKLVNEFSSAISQMDNGVNELKSRTYNIWVSYQTHLVPTGSTGHLEVPGQGSRDLAYTDSNSVHLSSHSGQDNTAFDFSKPSAQIGSFSNGFFNQGSGTGDLEIGTAILPSDSSASPNKRLSMGSS